MFVECVEGGACVCVVCLCVYVYADGLGGLMKEQLSLLC